MNDPKQEHVFVAVQIGGKEETSLIRANDLLEHVIEPAVGARGLEVWRSDLEPSPGPITNQIVRRIVNAKVVIADVTGLNANVYYELAIAHSFDKPVIIIADQTQDLAFDIKSERTVILGVWDGEISATAAKSAQSQLEAALDVVLANDYMPESIVSAAVKDARRLSAIASNEPEVAEELGTLRGQMDEVLRRLTEESRYSDLEAMKAALEYIYNNAKVFPPEDLVGEDTSPLFDSWAAQQENVWEELQSKRKAVKTRQVVKGPSVAPPPTPDDVPF